MKRNFKWMNLILFMLVSTAIQAARVDTLHIHSKKMNRDIKTLVVLPKLQESSERIPTLYLLHGYGGDARSWLVMKPALREMADKDHVLIVCPDGENSWYWDSPLQPDSQFETFVSSELIQYIDTHYPTLRQRDARAITGLSMGGHGGLWLSFRHKDIFGACGSMSGGVDIRPFPKKWEMTKQIGQQDENKARWDAHTVMTQLNQLKNGELAIIFDCGSDDIFFEVNCKLHNTLQELGIQHDFVIRPGKHNWAYWKNSIEYQWLYFTRYFRGYRSPIP